MIDKARLGISFFDQRYGGIHRKRAALCVGRYGSGKTIVALQALMQSVHEGERGGMLSAWRAQDLAVLAGNMGLPLSSAIEKGQIVLLEHARPVDDHDRYGLLLNTYPGETNLPPPVPILLAPGVGIICAPKIVKAPPAPGSHRAPRLPAPSRPQARPPPAGSRRQQALPRFQSLFRQLRADRHAAAHPGRDGGRPGCSLRFLRQNLPPIRPGADRPFRQAGSALLRLRLGVTPLHRFRHLALVAALWGCCGAALAADRPLPIAPDAFLPGSASPPAETAADGAVALRFPAGAVDRIYWDLPIHRLDPAATLLAVDLTCDDPSAVRALTLHLRDGSDWLSASAVPGAAGRQTLYFHRDDFRAETGAPDWSRATVLRVSLWRGSGAAATVLLHAIRPQTPAIAILRGSDLTAPGETALAAQCADRARRLFERAGLPAAIVSDDVARLDLRRHSLLVLPYNPVLSDRQVAILERFAARRGRLAVFYHANERLARRLGFKPLPYATQSEPWLTVAFYTNAVPGLPSSMAHFTQHLLPVRADQKRAGHLGRWVNPDGIPDHSLPACAVSPRGIWFSHVPPLATPPAVRWLLSALAVSDPATYAAARDRLSAETARRDAQAAALSDEAPAPEGEIRAVWTLPLSPRTRDETIGLLATNGVNAVFEQLSVAGFAHYHVDESLPRSDLGRKRNHNFLPRALQIAHTNGIALHAWIVCWNLDGLPAELVDPLRAQGRLMQDARGNELPWLCPLHPDNRARLLDALRDLARRGLDGIHLDYIRYPARDGCYCLRHREAFERLLGRAVANWPADVLPGGPHADAYEQFRRDDLSAFVAEAAAAARAIRPAIRFSAAVYPAPASAAENGQDWPRWLRDGSLDFACPMAYAPDAARFDALLDLALAAAPPGKILPGIGTGADESQLDALAAAEQILAARRRRLPGFVFYRLDSDLTDLVLPLLGFGFRRPPASP